MSVIPERGDYLAYVMGVYDEADKVAGLEAEVATLQAEAVTLQAQIDNLTATIASRDAQIVTLNTTVADKQAAITALTDQLDAANAEIERLQAIIDAGNTPAAATALIGLSASDFDAQQSLLEATGGALRAARRFDNGNGLAGLQSSCPPVAAKGLALVPSCKPGDWGNAAAGSMDDEWRAQAEFLAGLGVEVWGVQHHEPGKKSLGDPLLGEGGTAAEFCAMQARCADIYHAAGLKFAVIMNGWQFDTGKGGALTDAQWDVWLSPALRDKLDVIAADHYQIAAGAPDPTDQFLKHVARCEAWGKRWGIGEFNAYDASMITSMGEAAKANAGTGAFACLWATNDYTFTSGPRLTAAQAIVKGWEG